MLLKTVALKKDGTEGVAIAEYTRPEAREILKQASNFLIRVEHNWTEENEKGLAVKKQEVTYREIGLEDVVTRGKDFAGIHLYANYSYVNGPGYYEDFEDILICIEGMNSNNINYVREGSSYTRDGVTKNDFYVFKMIYREEKE